MQRRGVLALSILLGVALPAGAAETLPIDGTYGNDAGCTLARTNNYGEDDSARILTADGVQTMVTACTFTKRTASTDTRFDVTMTCASEGSGPEDNYEDEARIEGDPQKGYTVAFADGTGWERLHKCE